MDGNSSDNSRTASENITGSWNWDTEDVSISRLHLEPTNDLHDVVEDKEIAACAVAFVVNGTRRGIVPLCADVASLMRSKRRLEKRVISLKRELESIRRASQHAGHSLSPTPTSVHSYSSDRGTFMDPAHVQVFNELLRGAQCSEAASQSSDSSQIGSPPLTQRRSRGGLRRTTACFPGRTQQSAQASMHRSANDLNMVGDSSTSLEMADDKRPTSSGCRANGCEVIGTSPTLMVSVDCCANQCDSGVDNASLSSRVADSVNLPYESEDTSSISVLHESESENRLKTSAATDDRSIVLSACQYRNSSPNAGSLEERFNRSLEVNIKLAEELATTRRQMQLLATKLQEFERHELSHCDTSFGQNKHFSESAGDLSSRMVGHMSDHCSSRDLSQDDFGQQLDEGVVIDGGVPRTRKIHDTPTGTYIPTADGLGENHFSMEQNPADSSIGKRGSSSPRAVMRPLHRSKALTKGNQSNNFLFLLVKADLTIYADATFIQPSCK